MDFLVPLWTIHGIALLALAIASYTDLREREVPDLINYPLIILGLILGLVASIISASFWPFISSLFGLFLGYLLGALMFYTGQWGGGDAKMLMGLGALVGFDLFKLIEQGGSSIASSFFVNVFITIILSGIIYGIGYLIVVAFRHRKEFKKAFHKKLQTTKIHLLRRIVLGTSFLIIIISLCIHDSSLRLTTFIFAAIIYVSFYFFLTIQIIEKNIMVSPMLVDELTPGEWVSKDLFFTVPEQSPVKSIKQKVALYYERDDNHTTKKRLAFINKKTKEYITKITNKMYASKHMFAKILWRFVSRSKNKRYDELHKKIIFALHLQTKEKFDAYVKKNHLEELENILKKEKIFFTKKYLAGPKDLGLNEEQIRIIKKQKLKTILVKKGVPFIPAFFLGYILSLVFLHWGTSIIQLISQIM